MQHDTVVVGAGLFGSVIAAALRAKGEDVLVVDAQLPNAGSRPAACLMKPSWFSSVPEPVRRRSLDLLDHLYGVETLRFTVAGLSLGPLSNVLWVKPSSILEEVGRSGATRAAVDRIDRMGKGRLRVWIRAPGDDLHYVTTGRVVVASGVWSEAILGLHPARVTPQVGSAWLWPTATTDNAIAPYAPYKQLVRFNRGDGAWVGDGMALKPESHSTERRQASLERCSSWAALQPRRATELVGQRPYAKPLAGEIGWTEELWPGLWIATGGAKNGTLAAGWAAAKITGN